MRLAEQAPADASLAERAYQELRSRILDMMLMPGQAVLESQLAAELGMSRTPIREATQRLREEGLVTTVTRKGVVVSWISADDLGELYEMMEGIEGVAVKLATERASDGLLDALERAVSDQERALAADDTRAWVEADARFHDLIVEGARNKRLARWMRNVNSQLHRVRVFVAPIRRKPTQSTAEHREVVAAMRARDAERARDLHVAHRARARREIVHILREYVSPPVRPS